MSSNSKVLGSSLEKLRQELDSLLESAWSNGGKALDKMGLRSTSPGFEPAVEVIETAESVVVIIDVPGLEPSAVDVSLVGNVLTVQGQRVPSVLAEGDKRHLSERPCGKFSKSISLPVSVDPESVSADIRHGVLTVRLSKLQILKPRHIPVSFG